MKIKTRDALCGTVRTLDRTVKVTGREQGRHSDRRARRHSPTAGARMNTPAIRCRTPGEPPQEQSFTEQTASEDGECGRRGRISGISGTVK